MGVHLSIGGVSEAQCLVDYDHILLGCGIVWFC